MTLQRTLTEEERRRAVSGAHTPRNLYSENPGAAARAPPRAHDAPAEQQHGPTLHDTRINATEVLRERTRWAYREAQ